VRASRGSFLAEPSIVQIGGRVEHSEFAQGWALKVWGEVAGAFAAEESLCIAAAKGLDHRQ
jgi:hypothetical protein